MSNTYLSTSAGYAILSYRTAYLKANYFLEYATAVLRSVQGDKSKLTAYANIVKTKGVDILFPCVNKSSLNMDIYDFEGNVISTGLLAISGLPEEMANNILKEREENGLFSSYDEFLERMAKYHIDAKSIKALIYSGALDIFEKNIKRMLSQYESTSAFYKRVDELKEGNQRSIFDIEELSPMIDYLQTVPDNDGYDLQERLSLLCEYNNVGIHDDVTASYKNIKYDLSVSRRQNDDDFVSKEGTVTGVLEDEFKISKKGKAYLTTLRTFNGELIKLIVAKSKVDEVTDDINQYKKGMAVDVLGGFKFPKVVEGGDDSENDDSQGFVNNDIVSFPKEIIIKELDTPIVPISVELNFDEMIIPKEVVQGYFGVENYNDVVSKVLNKFSDDSTGKIITIIQNGNTFKTRKRVLVTLDEIKKLGCTYTIK